MKRLIVLLVVVAAVVAVAAFTVDSNAATVNGAAITNATVNSDLAAIGSSSGYQCYLAVDAALNNGSAVTPVYGVGGSSTYNTVAANAWLSQLVEGQLIAGLVAERGVTITPDDLSAGRATLLEQITGVLGEGEQQSLTCPVQPSSAQEVLDSLPGWFVNAQVLTQANEDALLAHEAGYGLSSADLQQYFDDHPTNFQKICASEVEVGTEATANQIVAAVKAGSTFAQAAAAADTTVDSGCVTPADSNYSSVFQAVDGLTPGQLSSVLTLQQSSSTTQGAYALLQLTSRTAATFAESGSAVRDALLTGGSKKADDALVAAVRRAEVTVDPRYGTWRPGASLIALPRQPRTSLVLNPVANDPSASG